MMIKMLGQLVFAAVLVQMYPVDAAFLEFQVGAPSAYSSNITVDNFDEQIAGLPESADRELYPIKVDRNSYGIVTTAQSVIVVDVESGMILLAEHPDQIRSIGSVTKLMTVLVFLETEPDLSRTVKLDSNLDLVEGGRIYLGFNTGIALEDILAASIVGSDNTATESLVRFSGLSMEDFVSRMNVKAIELKMTSTTFTDPTGIRPSNKSTARDLLLLLEAAEQNPIIQKYMTTRFINVAQTNGRVISIDSTNSLLKSFLNEGEFTINGGKTGFLPEAGYVLATTVSKGGNSIRVIVMGSESKETRADEAKGLASWAFRVFKWPSQL